MTEKILNAAKQYILFTETSWIADVTEMMEARKQYNSIFKVLKEKICQSRLLHPEKNTL